MDISFIIVNYRTKELTVQCVSSIFNHVHGYNIEVIVVDNDSEDNSIEYIQKCCPKAICLQAPSNLGFGKGNNLGAKVARGEILVFINSDAFINSNKLISRMIKLTCMPMAGLCSCTIVYGNGDFQTAGEKFPTLWHSIKKKVLFLDSRMLRKHVISRCRRKHEIIRSVDWVSGAFFCVRKEIFIRLGGFDKQIFLNCEDIDICARAKKDLGLKNLVDPTVQVVHLHSESKKKISFGQNLNKYKNNIESNFYVIKKNKLSNFPSLINYLYLYGFLARQLYRKIFHNCAK